MSERDDDFDEIDDGEDGDEFDYADLSCGLMPDGGCTNAGTEWCDWSCPYSSEARAIRKRSTPVPGPLLKIMERDK